MTFFDLARNENGSMLPCSSIPTFVRVIGAGPPVVVVHGGPGFSHDHLVAPLVSLAGRRSLVFYDQPGCGRSGGSPEQLTPQLLADHFRALLGMIGQPFGLVAHSWGSFVALAAAVDEAAPREGLIITPAAPTRAGWDAAVARLLARIPPDVAARFMADLASEPEVVFDPLLPFYCTRPVSPDSATLKVRAATYLSLVGRLGDFDHRSQARRRAPAIDVVFGADDFTPLSAWEDIAGNSKRSTTLETGHFPFWEDPVGFEQVLAQAFA